jgi:serine/threonine protein phosphatase PrpC
MYRDVILLYLPIILYLFFRSLASQSSTSISPTFHIGTACFSKTFSATNFNASDNDDVPLRNNGNECGEDDFLVSQRGDIKLLIVSDGVGSWSRYGINPKIFTRELLKSINVQFKLLNNTIIAEHDKRKVSFLLNIIRKAYDNVQRTKRFIRFGSCTVVSLSLNIKTLHLNSYVLGDSGFMIIRNNRIVYRSKDLLHGFNFPYQLAFMNEHSNSPNDGFIRPFKLRVNDVIIMGSDGLFDNLFDEAILYYVKSEVKYLSSRIQKGYSETARKIAKHLTITAKRIGEIVNDVSTPFSEEVNSLQILNYKVFNGKNDDTTVLAIIIS